jgi:hypothetical protein
MFVQFENPALIKSQTFPDRVAALHDGVKRADARLVAMAEFAVDVDQQVAILFVELL